MWMLKGFVCRTSATSGMGTHAAWTCHVAMDLGQVLRLAWRVVTWQTYISVDAWCTHRAGIVANHPVSRLSTDQHGRVAH
jgi:hypothetical protein